MRRNRPRHALLPTALLIAAAGGILLAACGGDNTSSSGTSSVTTASSDAPAGSAAPEVNPAGDIPDNQAFVTFVPPDRVYAVKVPEGWARTDANGSVSFTDKLNTIDVQVVPMTSAPTVASVRADELPTIAQNAQGYAPGDVTEVTRTAGPTVLATYRADSAPSPVTSKAIKTDVERYEFWRDGTAVVLTLSGPVGADNVDPWRIVTDSFAWAP